VREQQVVPTLTTSYQITFPKEENYVVMHFTLKYVRCDNYPREEAGACKEEQGNFELLSLVDMIAQTVNVPDLDF
jgi:hypothetical protein